MINQLYKKTRPVLLIAVAGAAYFFNGTACNTDPNLDPNSASHDPNGLGQPSTTDTNNPDKPTPVAQQLCGTITISAVSGQTSVPATAICAGSDLTLQASFDGACGNAAHQWSVASGNCSISGANDGETVVVSAAAGGTGSCQISYSLACANCEGPNNSSATLAIGSMPVAGIDAVAPRGESTDNTACVPDAGAGATYNWTISGATITSGQGTACITYSVGDVATGANVSLDVEVKGNACVNTGTLDLAVQAGPPCSVTASSPFPNSISNSACVPDAGPGATYNWSITGGTITAGQGTPCITYSANSVDSVTFNTSVTLAGETCTSSLVVNTQTDLLCTLQASDVFASSTGNVASVQNVGAGATYAWTITGGSITSGQGTSSIEFSANASGSVNLSVNVGLNGTTCTAASTLEILPGVEPCEMAAAAPCPNSSGNTACAPDVGPEGIYIWNITGGVITSGASDRCITYSAGGAGVVTLEVHIIGFLCDCIVTQELPIESGPSTAISAITPCPNSTGNSASVPDAGVGAAYTWTITGGTITSGQGTRTITYTAGASGMVSLGISISGTTGCTVSGTKNSEISPFPAAAISASNPCANSTGNSACVPFAGDGSTYAWTITGGTITSGQGTACITYSAGASGSVNLGVSVTSGHGCNSLNNKALTVQASPTVTITANPPCPNSTGNVATSTNAGVGAIYTWTLTNATITSGQGTASIQYTANGSGNVGLSVAVETLGGCLGNASQSVAITVNPTTTITAPTPCVGSLGNAASVPDAGVGATYSWSITGGTITAGQGTRSLTYTAGNGASVILNVTVATANGCALNGSQTIALNPIPVASITAGPACTGSTSNVATVPDAGVGATYSWSITGGTIVGGQGTRTLTFAVDSGASANLNVTVARNSCSANGTKVVLITPPPTCTFNPPTVPGVLTGIIVGGTPPYTVSANVQGLGWAVLNTQVDNAGVGPGFTLTYSFDHSQMVEVGSFSSTFTDDNGCVQSPCTIQVPCF